jgi:hypothetical protein
MDPNLFHIDYERLFEVLVAIVVVSMFVERSLSILFESRPFIEKFKNGATREIISFIVSVAVCIVWEFDAITILLVSNDTMTLPGMVVTGAIVAGGSKGSVKLFKDVLGFMSSAEKERQAKKQVKLKTLQAS